MIIIIPLKDASETGVATTCGVGTVYDLGALEDQQSLYAGLHVLSTAAGANTILVKIFSASSSGVQFDTSGVSPTCRFGFTAVACRDAQWSTPVTGAFATCQRFWRAQWATSCVGRKLLTWISRSCVDPV